MWRSIVVLTVAAVASACAGHTTPQAQPGTTVDHPTSSAASTTAPDPTAEVLETINRYWVLWLADNNPPNPADQRLSTVLTGVALAKTLESMRARLVQHESIRLPRHTRFRHAVERVRWNQSRSSALVRECVLDDSELVSASGVVLNSATATYELEKTVSTQDAGWRIVRSVQRARWRGVAGCAA